MKEVIERPSASSSRQGQVKRIFELSLGGLPYRLRTSHDEATARELVRFVDEKIQQAMDATKSASYQNAAVLAALNIAEELILLKRKASRELERLEEKALRITQDLNNHQNSKRDVNA